MNRTELERKREETMTRIKRRQTIERLKRKRAATFQAEYTARILPGRTASEIHLAEIRAASRYNKLPKVVKDVMKDNGFDPLMSKHYATDIF